jgi:hypothetical protein
MDAVDRLTQRPVRNDREANRLLREVRRDIDGLLFRLEFQREVEAVLEQHLARCRTCKNAAEAT